LFQESKSDDPLNLVQRKVVILDSFQRLQPYRVWNNSEPSGSTMEQRTGRNTVTIQLPLDFSWGNKVWNFLWDAVSAFFLEPVLDSSGLVDLSIALLLLERIGTFLQPSEQKLLPAIVTDSSLFVTINELAHSVVLGSPAIGLLGSLALLFSCFANSSFSSTPSWLRQGSGNLILYIILILFCLESSLILSILLIACQTLHFDESGGLLLVLFLCCLTSLVGSNYARRYLFQHMTS
jgi:hypothetical protein